MTVRIGSTASGVSAGLRPRRRTWARVSRSSVNDPRSRGPRAIFSATTYPRSVGSDFGWRWLDRPRHRPLPSWRAGPQSLPWDRLGSMWFTSRRGCSHPGSGSCPSSRPSHRVTCRHRPRRGRTFIVGVNDGLRPPRTSVSMPPAPPTVRTHGPGFDDASGRERHDDQVMPSPRPESAQICPTRICVRARTAAVNIVPTSTGAAPPPGCPPVDEGPARRGVLPCPRSRRIVTTSRVIPAGDRRTGNAAFAAPAPAAWPGLVYYRRTLVSPTSSAARS